MRVDFHAHILPREWPDLAARYGDPRWPTIEHLDACSARIMADGKLFRAVTDQLYVTERRLADMDATGVDRQVLSTVPVMFSYWAEPAQTREMSRYLNEHLAEVVGAHPDRFSALGHRAAQRSRAGDRGARALHGELGMAGVEIGTNVAGLDLDDPRFLPFFQRAAELGAIVFVHPWQVVGAGRMAQYYFLYTVAMPSETAFAVGALLFGGVLEQAPGPHVVFAHGGGSAPYIIGRMEQGWRVWEPARERLSRAAVELLPAAISTRSRGMPRASSCWSAESVPSGYCSAATTRSSWARSARARSSSRARCASTSEPRFSAATRSGCSARAAAR